MVTIFPTSKPEINEWWEQQPSQLDLPEHMGNCVTCFKKSTPKLIQIAKDTPEFFDFMGRMETKYGVAGHNVDGNKRTFFREHRSTVEILAMSKILKPNLQTDIDFDSGCSESCEAFS